MIVGLPDHFAYVLCSRFFEPQKKTQRERLHLPGAHERQLDEFAVGQADIELYLGSDEHRAPWPQDADADLELVVAQRAVV